MYQDLTPSFVSGDKAELTIKSDFLCFYKYILLRCFTNDIFLFLLIYNSVTYQYQHIMHRKQHIFVVLLSYLANLSEFQTLQRGIVASFQELNVRQLTLSTDKDKYGIRLRAEPDHMVLGKRLKAAFKAITASIKELSSEQLEVFQKTGMSTSLFVCPKQ